MKRFFAVLLLTLIAFAGGAMSTQLAHAGHGDGNPFTLLGQLARVLVLIETTYVDPVERDRLLQGAIKGMVAELDPHSSYLPPAEHDFFREDTDGRFGGVGIEVEQKDGDIVVVQPLEGAPAARAGIRRGDRILAVNGRSLRGQALEKLVRLLRGEPGTQVELTVLRGEKFHTLRLQREEVQLVSVTGKRLEGNVAYVRIKQFQGATHSQFLQVVAALRGSPPRPLTGILLDVRDNPGGLIDEAAAIADEFLDGGVIYTLRRRGQLIEEAKAHGGGALLGSTVAVLINEGTASASELLAGALRDNKRAKLVGTTTFGKGSVQTLLNLPSGAGLRLTTMRYYTPSGQGLQALGVTPDVVVASPKSNFMSGLLREQDLDNHLPAEAATGHLLPRSSDKLLPTNLKFRSEALPSLPHEDEKVVEVSVNPSTGTDRVLAVGYRLVCDELH